MYQLTASWRIICGSAAGLAVLVGEIREVPAVQRQAALEQGTDDNWNKARNLKEVCVWGGGGENRYSTKGREKKSSGSRRGRRNEEGRGRWGMRGR